MPAIVYVGGVPSSGNAFVKKWAEGVWSNMPTIPFGYSVYSISGTSENDIWVGMSTGGSREFDLYHWDGVSWTRQTLPDQVAATQNRVVVEAWDANTVFAIGSNSAAGYWRLWKTTNGGASWSTLDNGTLELNYARPVTMLVTGEDEVYMCGASGALSPGFVALWRWNGSMAREVIGNLPRTDVTYGYHYHYSGLAWDRADASSIWITNVGSSGDSDAGRLRKGVFGSSWVEQQQFNPGAGYSQTFFTATDRVMTMDDLGTMGIVAFGGGVWRILFGDPTAAPPMSEVSGITANAGIGEKASMYGHFMMTDNEDGLRYDPDTALWTVPDNGDWGNGKGAHVIAGPGVPVRTTLGANYVDGVRYDDPSTCVGAINQIPANGETDVDSSIAIRLHLVSYLNAAVE
jgi:hypothetical protein